MRSAVCRLRTCPSGWSPGPSHFSKRSSRWASRWPSQMGTAAWPASMRPNPHASMLCCRGWSKRRCCAPPPTRPRPTTRRPASMPGTNPTSSAVSSRPARWTDLNPSNHRAGRDIAGGLGNNQSGPARPHDWQGQRHCMMSRKNHWVAGAVHKKLLHCAKVE